MLKSKPRVIRPVKLPKEMLQSKVIKIVSCTGPIPCISLEFENGYRLDVGVTGNPEKSYQIIEPEENPYYKEKNPLGKACQDFRAALNKIGYTTSNLIINYPFKPNDINDCIVYLYITKKKRGQKK